MPSIRGPLYDICVIYMYVALILVLSKKGDRNVSYYVYIYICIFFFTRAYLLGFNHPPGPLFFLINGKLRVPKNLAYSHIAHEGRSQGDLSMSRKNPKDIWHSMGQFLDIISDT